jgi:hypothetical protein
MPNSGAERLMAVRQSCHQRITYEVTHMGEGVITDRMYGSDRLLGVRSGQKMTGPLNLPLTRCHPVLLTYGKHMALLSLHR